LSCYDWQGVVTRLLAFFQGLLRRDSGASLVEYALALLLIAVVTIAMITILGTSLSTFFSDAASTI
jgi:pilus assembly protein Flp/PilA